MADFIENLRKIIGNPIQTPPSFAIPQGLRTLLQGNNSEKSTPKGLSMDEFRELRERDTDMRGFRQSQSGRHAYNGTLFETTDPYENPRFMTQDYRYSYVTDEVLKNYDELNSMLDKYDAAPTFDGKMDVIKKAWDKLDVSSWKHPEWFLQFADWTDQMNEGDKDFDSLSSDARKILNFSKNNKHKVV